MNMAPKSPIPYLICCLLFWLIPGLAFAQDTLIFQGCTQISLSSSGQILACDKRSNLVWFDSTGKRLFHFSPKRPASVHLLEGWNGLRPFVFYRDFQEFIVLDRFLLADESFKLNPETVGFCRLATPAADGNLWVIDERTFELKKLDWKSQKVLYSTPLNLILPPRNYDLAFMREYQNNLYLADQKGAMLVFDQMGNFKRKLPLQNVRWFSFLGDECYTSSSDSIHYFHPFRNELRKEPLPKAVAGALKVLKFNDLYFWIDKSGLRMLKK